MLIKLCQTLKTLQNQENKDKTAEQSDSVEEVDTSYVDSSSDTTKEDNKMADVDSSSEETDDPAEMEVS